MSDSGARRSTARRRSTTSSREMSWLSAFGGVYGWYARIGKAIEMSLRCSAYQIAFRISASMRSRAA